MDNDNIRLNMLVQNRHVGTCTTVEVCPQVKGYGILPFLVHSKLDIADTDIANFLI